MRRSEVKLVGGIIEKIANVKVTHLVREYAPGFYKAQGIEAEFLPLPTLPDLSKVESLSELDKVVESFLDEAHIQFPEEDEDISGIMDSGKGSKYFNELPLGSYCEVFLEAYKRLLPKKDGTFVVNSYDLDQDVFFTDTIGDANDLATFIAPATVFKLDSTTNPPRLYEVNCL